MKAFFSTLFSSKKHVWIFFAILLGVIILTNAKWGYGLLGNDNFSPELNPKITLQRSLQNPGWRTYRALGVPSDSEQADTIRTLMFYLLSLAKVPYWVLSQVYFFGTLGIALVSAAKVAEIVIVSKGDNERTASHSLLLGGLFYFSSLLTVWIYYFPVHLFIAAYAFLPLVAWRLLAISHNFSAKNALYLSIAGLLLGISGLTATMFLVCIATLGFFSIGISLTEKKFSIQSTIYGLGLIIVLNLYWLMPFFIYVHTNTGALQDSLINRKITTLQVQNEQKYTVLPNTVRYAFSWLDDQLSTGAYAYTSRTWYNNIAIKILGYLPFMCALFGSYVLISKKKKWGSVAIILLLGGLFLMKGTNPPFGFFYAFLQETSHVFNQVFRWRSSKFWPLLALSIPLLATYGALIISKKRPQLLLVLVAALCIYILPMLTGSLIRPSMYTKVPDEYFALSQYLSATNDKARIYVAPEANTLYFRNYKWGFFGSVILNYILPNPIFEKALVIGSAESELAFNHIKNTYYSGDIEKFNSSLDHYKIEYVLEDTSVTKGESGYDYDLSLNDEMLANNPRMFKEWSQGTLTLYAFEPTTSPISMPSSVFSLPISEISHDHMNDSIIHTSKQFDGKYTFSYPEQAVYESSARARLEENAIVIEPGAPKISLDGQNITPQLPSKKLAFSSLDAQKISLNQRVLHSLIPTLLHLDFASIDENVIVQSWQLGSSINLLDGQSTTKLFCNNAALQTHFTVKDGSAQCGSGTFALTEDMILEPTMNITASEPVQLSWCFSSAYAQGCIQSDRFYTIDGRKHITLTVPDVIRAGDTIEMFMNIKPLSSGSQPEITINQLTWDLYKGKNMPVSFSETAFIPEARSINLTGVYPISIFIPQSTTPLSSRFELNYSLLNEKGSAKRTDSAQTIQLLNTESSTSLHASLPRVSRDRLLLLVQGSHKTGIPAEISLKSEKQGAALYENQLYAERKSAFQSIVYVPKGNPTLSLDILSRGIGNVPSDQILSVVDAVPIPASWEYINFNSEKSAHSLPIKQAYNDGFGYVVTIDKPTRVVLNTAASPHWRVRKVESGTVDHILRASLAGESVHVESAVNMGWEQEFQLIEPGTYVIVFWPNYLVYVGYALVLGIVGGLGLYIVLRAVSSKKSHESYA